MVRTSPDPARRNERSRRAILDAAVAVVAEYGYERASIQGIAERAGVGKQTIYRWWPSKGAVILEALEERVEQVTPLPLPDSGSIVEDLRYQMRAVVQILGSPDFGPAYRALVAAAQSDAPLSRANIDRLIEPRAVALKELLEQAQARGEVRANVDLETVVDLLIGSIFYRLLLQTRPLDPAQVDAALDIAFKGLH